MNDMLILESNPEFNYLLLGNKDIPCIFTDLELTNYIDCLEIKEYLYSEILNEEMEF